MDSVACLKLAFDQAIKSVTIIESDEKTPNNLKVKQVICANTCMRSLH